MNRAFAVLPALLLAALPGCEKKATPPAPPVTVTATPVAVQTVWEKQTWVGLLDGYQNADIRAQVAGYLTSQNYKEGSFVKKGTVLFLIDQRPFQAALEQAEAQYAQMVAKAQLSQITLDRQTQLYKTKVISQQEYDTYYQTAQADIASAAAAQAAVQTAQINLNYCTITAPFDGIAGVAQAQIGDLVGPGSSQSVLTQMSQIDPIKVNFSITEQEYLGAAKLLNTAQDSAPQDIPARIELRLADGTVYGQKGRYDFVNRQVNVATGSIQITALFPNEGLFLRPGLFGRVTAPVRQIENAILVPQQSVTELQGNHMVAVVGPGDVIQIRPVKVGPTEGPLRVIEKGLNPGDKVVVGGVEKVRSGMKVIVQPYAPPAASATPAPQKSE
jgi:membrane fusion protein (multidrug efflux system)